ncbi:MAG: hypothetical protein LBE12_08275 [Planctomycetaceae bacterium]|nr:hypothetical protein [Planctomycetaceae bacterium]
MSILPLFVSFVSLFRTLKKEPLKIHEYLRTKIDNYLFSCWALVSGWECSDAVKQIRTR